MFHDPAISPWGNIQTSRTLCPGVFEVSTASHGGIMAAKGVVSKIFSDEAQKCGFWERGYLCFEEDCDAQVALRELMDRGLFTAPVNQHFGPGEYSACIDGSTESRWALTGGLQCVSGWKDFPYVTPLSASTKSEQFAAAEYAAVYFYDRAANTVQAVTVQEAADGTYDLLDPSGVRIGRITSNGLERSSS